MKLALREYLDTWKFAFNADFRNQLREADRLRARKEAGLEDDTQVQEQGQAVQLPSITKEDVREGAIHAAKRLKEAATDEDLRVKLASLGTLALRTARDGLDSFLLGYTEGKHEEIRAWLQEEQSKEVETKERMKRVRQLVEAELAQRRAMDAHAASTATGGSWTESKAAGTGSSGLDSARDARAQHDQDARVAAAAAAALQSVASDPAVQSLKEMLGAIKSVAMQEGTGSSQPQPQAQAQAGEAKLAAGAPASTTSSGKGEQSPRWGRRAL